MPFKCSNLIVWKWFRLAKYVEYSKHRTSHSEYQRAYCCKCLSDGINPVKASVVYRDSTQGTTSMTAHISKNHAGEEAPILQKKNEARGLEKAILGVARLAKYNLLCPLFGKCKAKVKSS